MEDNETEIKPWTHFYWDIFANTCWPFDEASVVCGRTDGHFQYEDSQLSSTHCEFSIENNKCFLTDLDSTNGTHLNMKEVVSSMPMELKCFDVIVFGSQIIIYFNENIFKVKTREELLEHLHKNIDNEDIFTEVKNKTILFMRSHHPRMIVKKKIQVLETKISDAFNMKEDKLGKYIDKSSELDGHITQLKTKIEELAAKKEKVIKEQELLASKIDPQINSLIEQKENFENEYERLTDLTKA